MQYTYQKVVLFYLLKSIYLDDTLKVVEVYFEENPFHLRKIRIRNEDGIISFTIINPNFHPNLNDKIFRTEKKNGNRNMYELTPTPLRTPTQNQI